MQSTFDGAVCSRNSVQLYTTIYKNMDEVIKQQAIKGVRTLFVVFKQVG